jgi:hypothetical protein
VRVCTCGAFQYAGTLGTLIGQESEKVAGFLAAAVFVLWALRDSVLALNGCALPFLNFISFFPWCKLCKKATVGLSVVDARLQIPKVLTRGEGKDRQSPSPRSLRARPRRGEGHFVALAGGSSTRGAGAKGRSL